jgi:hypothetical protein
MSKKKTVLGVLENIETILHNWLPVPTGAAINKKGEAKFLDFLWQAIANKEITFWEIINAPDRIVKLPDGWFKDKLLGIDIAPKSLEKKLTNKGEAKKYCAEHGGRLPEDYELDSFVDRRKYNPAIIDAAKQLELESDDYWSGTTYADGTDSAWIVYFGHGDVYYGSKDYGWYVRPVRSSQ